MSKFERNIENDSTNILTESRDYCTIFPSTYLFNSFILDRQHIFYKPQPVTNGEKLYITWIHNALRCFQNDSISNNSDTIYISVNVLQKEEKQNKTETWLDIPDIFTNYPVSVRMLLTNWHTTDIQSFSMILINLQSQSYHVTERRGVLKINIKTRQRMNLTGLH